LRVIAPPAGEAR